MNVLVVYESQRGHTRQTAEAIATAVRAQGGEVVVKPVADIRAGDVQGADVLFAGTWVQGFILFGVRPAGAAQWVPALPPLMGKPVGVFCTYAFNPRSSLRALDRMLEARGATVLGEHAFHRARPSDGAEQFVGGMLKSAGVVLR
jgi:flavodoxin